VLVGTSAGSAGGRPTAQRGRTGGPVRPADVTVVRRSSTPALTLTTSPNCSSLRWRDPASRKKKGCGRSPRSRFRRETVSEAVRRNVDRAAPAVARVARPDLAHQCDRHRHRRARRFRRTSGVGFGRRGRLQLRRAGHLAAGDNRRPRYMDGGVAAWSILRWPTTARSSRAGAVGQGCRPQRSCERGRRGRSFPRAAFVCSPMMNLSRRSVPIRSTRHAGFRPRVPAGGRAAGGGRRHGFPERLNPGSPSGQFVERFAGQLAPNGDHLGGTVEFEAAARGAGHLDEQIGRIGGERVAGPARPGRWSIVRFITSKLPSFGTDAPLPASTSCSSPSASASDPGVRHRCRNRAVGLATCGSTIPSSHEVRCLWLIASTGLAAGQADRDRQVGVDRGDGRIGSGSRMPPSGEQTAVEHMRRRSRRGSRSTPGSASRPGRAAASTDLPEMRSVLTAV